LSENLPHFLHGEGEQRREAMGTREEDMRKVFFSFPFIPFSSFFLLLYSDRWMTDGRTVKNESGRNDKW
jgi:hypothetical protein